MSVRVPSFDQALLELSPRRARLAATLALALLAWLALRPLLGERYPDGHDAWIYPTRIILFETALAEGQFPPLWAAALASGHGQPHFEFVPPLLYALAMPLRLVGGDLTRSICLPLALLHVLGMVAVYRIARRRSGRLVATATATAWLYAPYVATDLFVRAAFAEAVGVAAAPIALLFVLRLFDRPEAGRVVAAALATSLVILSHVAVALLFVGMIAFLTLLRPGAARVSGIGALVYALALTAFFWMPAMVERQYSKVERLKEEREVFLPKSGADVGETETFLESLPKEEKKMVRKWLKNRRERALLARDRSQERAADRRLAQDLGLEATIQTNHERHALAPIQLIWSPWGYGNSRAGSKPDEMSFEIGWLHVLLGMLGALAAWRDPDRGRGRERLAFFVVAVGAAWITTDLSMWLWDRIRLLQYLAFPWRALFLPALCLPLVMAGVFERIGQRATLAALVAIVLWNLPHLEPWRTVEMNDDYYTVDSIERRGLRASGIEEYAPRWAFMGTAGWPVRLRSPGGEIAVEELERSGIREIYSVKASQSGAVQAAPFFYPGWRVLIEGREVPVRPASRSGVLEFDLPAGEHEVAIEFRRTPTRWIADLCSALTLVVMLGVAVRQRRSSGTNHVLPDGLRVTER